MTEIPEHLLKAARETREKVGSTRAGVGGLADLFSPQQASSEQRTAGSAQDDEGQDLVDDTLDRLENAAFDASKVLAQKIADSLGELPEGVLFSLTIERKDGQINVNLSMSDIAFGNTLVGLLNSL